MTKFNIKEPFTITLKVFMILLLSGFISFIIGSSLGWIFSFIFIRISSIVGTAFFGLSFLFFIGFFIWLWKDWIFKNG